MINRHFRNALPRRVTLPSVFLLLIVSFLGPAASGQSKQPNIIVIFCDDLGYGDLGAYGNPVIRTPHLDQLAAEGQKWTNFYTAAPVCTPSRAGLLTGRFPVRSGMSSSKRRVLFPNSNGGLPGAEITIAAQLKQAGYSTAAIGKWHLGHLPGYLPDAHGFDTYFGIPYSNDMDYKAGADVNRRDAFLNPKTDYFQVPLLRDRTVIEKPADQTTVTKRYTEEAVKLIRQKSSSPFFIYLAHSMPHVPLFRSAAFENKSLGGLYGDVIEELDWSVGQIVEALKKTGKAENTLVVFTSDNGPWLTFRTHGGSAGPLRGGKGGTFEGGLRVPAIFWWPSKISAGVVTDLGTTLDLFPTLSRLSGAKVPSDRVYDGYDLADVLLKKSGSPRNEVFFYRDTDVFAVRKGAYKAHFITQEEYGKPDRTVHETPLLYNLNLDPGEKYDVAAEHPDIIKELRALLEAHQKTVVSVENQLEK